MHVFHSENNELIVLVLEPADLDTLRDDSKANALTKSFGMYRPAQIVIFYSEKMPELMPRFKRGELTIQQLVEQL